MIVGNTEVGIGGDLIMELEGQRVERPDALSRVLNNKRPGDVLEMTIYRGGRKIKMKVTLGERPDERL